MVILAPTSFSRTGAASCRGSTNGDFIGCFWWEHPSIGMEMLRCRDFMEMSSDFMWKTPWLCQHSYGKWPLYWMIYIWGWWFSDVKLPEGNHEKPSWEVDAASHHPQLRLGAQFHLGCKPIFRTCCDRGSVLMDQDSYVSCWWLLVVWIHALAVNRIVDMQILPLTLNLWFPDCSVPSSQV